MQPLNAPPRDHLTADQVLSLLHAGNVEIDFGADLLAPDLSVVDDISDDLAGGRVQRNNNASVHGTCDLSLSRELRWGVDLVRPWMSLSRDVLVTLTGQTVIDRPARSVSQVSDDAGDWAAGTGSDVDGSDGVLRLGPGTIYVPRDPAVNVALNKPVASSHALSGGNALVTDGNSVSGHASTPNLGGTTAWVEIDLGATYMVNAVHVWHFYSDGRIYTNPRTEVSVDGVAWTVVAEPAPYNETAAGNRREFDAVEARYVRDYIGGSNANDYAHWIEVEVYDTEAVEGGYATSGTWTSPALDLSTLVAVSSSLVDWQAATPAGATLTVETSTDGGLTWQAATDGGPIPGATPGGAVQARLTLTSDGTTTPEVSSLLLSVSQSEQLHTETVRTVQQETARWNLGVFSLTTPERAVGETPPTFDVQGYDRLSLLQREVGADYTVAAGTTYRQAILDAITAAGLTGVLIDGDAANDTLPADKTWLLVGDDQSDPDQTDTPVTWLRIVNDLLRAINFRAVWADENGYFRCSAYRDPAARGSEMTLDADDERTIVGEDRTVTRDVWAVPNRWVFRQTNRPDGAPAPTEGDGVYTVDLSDTVNGDWLGRTLVWTSVVDYEAASQAKLVELGDARVATDRRVTTRVELTTGPIPGVGHWDVITVRDVDAGLHGKAQITEWELPLTGEDMSMSVEMIG